MNRTGGYKFLMWATEGKKWQGDQKHAGFKSKNQNNT